MWVQEGSKSPTCCWSLLQVADLDPVQTKCRQSCQMLWTSFRPFHASFGPIRWVLRPHLRSQDPHLGRWEQRGFCLHPFRHCRGHSSSLWLKAQSTCVSNGNQVNVLICDDDSACEWIFAIAFPRFAECKIQGNAGVEHGLRRRGDNSNNNLTKTQTPFQPKVNARVGVRSEEPPTIGLFG